MKILYINSNHITKDDIVWGLTENDYSVEYYDKDIDMDEYHEDEMEMLARVIWKYDMVFSQNFIPAVAEICRLKDRRYVSWVYDSPQIHLYTNAAKYDTNYVFVFDKMQYRRMKEIGLKHVFYMPLVANVSKSSAVDVSDCYIKENACDVSFIGSLYGTSWFDMALGALSNESQKEVNQLLDKLCCHWGPGQSIYGQLSVGTLNELRKIIKKQDESLEIDDDYAIETLFISYELARRERIELLSRSSESFKTVMHTKDFDKAEEIRGCVVKPPVYGEDLFREYYSAKINLNITMRSIETGIPQRVFDIMSVGGCVFSNYQEEIGELFEPNRDIVVFNSIEEFVDKADFYITHDELRTRVGINGYLRVRDNYTYPIAIKKIFECIEKES